MGQMEVLETLKDKGWMTKKQITGKLTDISPQGITDSLARLSKAGFVEVKKAPKMKHGYLYRIKEGL